LAGGAERPEEEVHEQRELGRGLVWLGTSNLFAKLLDAAGAVLVLRFLSKEELGLATLAWSTTTLAESFNSFGIGNAVIQAGELTDRSKATAHWYAIVTSTLLAGAVYAAAPAMASLYGVPQLTALIQISSAKLVFVGCANVPLAMASRSLRFGRLGLIASLSTVFASTLTIALAYLGWGAMAPVLGNTAHGAFQLLGMMILAPMAPRAAWSWAELKPLARTGWTLAGAGAASQVARNIDYWLLGRIGGAAALGSYRVAFDLAMLPTLTTLQVAARSALPVYARVAKTPERLGAAVAWTAQTASLILLLPVLIVFLEGEALFTAIGKASDPTLLLTLRLLCVCAFLRAAPQFALPALIATGHSRLTFVEAVVSSVVLAACILPGLSLFHVPAPEARVAAAWLVACLILVPIELALMRPLGPALRRQVLASFRAPVLVVTSVGIIAAGLAWLSPLPSGLLRLATHGSAIVGLYFLVVHHGLRLRLSDLRLGALPPAPPAS
jgi:O-antigen/teichoic acid export membrane protein